MDPNGRIYLDDPDKIPAEDRARLDGYLRGRAESDQEDKLEEMRAEVERLSADILTREEKVAKRERELARARAITKGPRS